MSDSPAPAGKRFFLIGAAFLWALAGFLSFPAAIGLRQEKPLEKIQSGDGLLLTAPLPGNLIAPARRSFVPPDEARVLENGIPLRIVAEGRKEIANAGWGRFRLGGKEVFFSTSDGRSHEGRQFSVQCPRFSIPEWILLPLWGATLLLTIRALAPAFPALLGMAGLAGGLGGIALAAGLWAMPDRISEGFFHGMAIPVLWSLSVALLTRKGGLFFLLQFAVATLLPTWAAYIHYAVQGNSHAWFLLGGLLPLGDANLHFNQAVEILRSGFAETGFNGRFLYPLYLASFLMITGENAHLAQILSSIVCLGCLAMLARTARPLLGIGGTTFLVFCSWMFFRVNGSWLSMTENLGLPLGLLAACLFVSGERLKLFLPCGIGLFLFGVGMAARPGALFILPALGLYCLVRFGGGFKNPRRLVGIGAATALALFAGFGTNHLATARVYKGASPAFQNFAFSLHGLLTGTHWSVSHDGGKGDPARVMEENKRLLRENPLRLVTGAARTLEYLWPRGFLFRFGKEVRAVGIGSLLALAGLIALCFCKEFSTQRGWILTVCAGIFLSLPFAPPWDAGSRPYAVTMPVVFLLCGIGLKTLLGLGARFCGFGNSLEPGNENARPSLLSEIFWPASASALVLLLVFSPLVLASRPPSPHDLHGERLLVTSQNGEGAFRVPREKFFEGLSHLSANQPAIRDRLIGIQKNFALELDWEGPRLRIRDPEAASQDGASLESGSLLIDESLER